MDVLIWILSSSVLILAVLAIRALFGRKLRPGLRYALWALVLVRLLVPGSFWQSPVSVESAASGAGLVRELSALENVESLTLSPDGRLTGTLREDAPSPAAPAQPDNAPGRTGGTASGDKQRVTIAENVTQREYTRMNRTLTVRRAAQIVWVTGCVAVLTLFVLTNITFYVNLHRRRRRLDADCPVRVYEVEGLSSSCLFLNAVYVNAEAAEDELKLRHVLAHELSHRRHLDGLWTLLRCAALTVHWFNPLVWLAASASRQDSELFADAGALRRLGDGERELYGQTLIRLSVHAPRSVSPLCAATAMSGGKKALRQRVELIARSPRATVAVLLAVAFIAGIAVGCTFAGAVSEEPAVRQNAGPSPAGTPTLPDNESTGGETDPAPISPAAPSDPNHYFYTGDGWTMEAPKLLGGDPALPFEVTVTSGDGTLYYAFSAPDGSSLTVYRDRYATAAERFDFMASQDGSAGDTDSLTVSYTDEDGTPREERYIDCPEGEGGHWEICVTGSGHLEELRQMASSFRVTPGTEPVIESDVTLRRLFADAKLDDMTITRIERGAASPAVSAAGSPHGAEYLDILRSLRWADDLAPYEGEEPGWCVVLETPDFRIAMNDVGWAGVTTAQGSFAAWIVDYEELYHESGLFGWERLTEWYDEAVAAENLTGEPVSADELEEWQERLATELYRDTDDWSLSPINGFFLSDWTDPRELDFGQFIAYFPLSTEIGAGYDEAEKQAVRTAFREKFGEDFKDQLPVHAIRVSDVDAVLREYAGITTQDLKSDWKNAPNVIYLSEYATLYTFTSDYGPGGFIPLTGTRDGDILTLCSADHILTIRESGGTWQFISHTPLL